MKPTPPAIVHNELATPDGTRLISRHRHDYVSHTDLNGVTYFLDGGHDYVRCSSHPDQQLITLTTDDSHDLVRNYLSWGTYGPQGDKPLHYIILKDMESSHIHNIITGTHWSDTNTYHKFFIEELASR